MTYLARRFALFVVTLLLITMVTFAVTHILPGDVATMILGTRSNPETLAALRQELAGLRRERLGLPSRAVTGFQVSAEKHPHPLEGGRDEAVGVEVVIELGHR